MNLLRILHKKKMDIIAIDKSGQNLELAKRLFPRITTIIADLSRDGDWKDSFKRASCVVQLQAQISAPTAGPYKRNNIRSIKEVCDACKRHKVPHLIHFSSSVVMSVADDHYTDTKKAGEKVVEASDVPYTMLRPPLMYGCFDVKHLGYLTRILEMSPVFPVPGSGRYMRQPLFVDDICHITENLIHERPKNRVFNVIGKERIDFLDCMKIIAEEKHLHRIFLPIPIPLFLSLLRVYSFITRKKPFVPDQLRALTAGDDFPVSDWDATFNVTYTSFREGIRAMLRSPYYKYRKRMVRAE